MNNITTILFDLDGTLLDTTPDFLAVINSLRLDKKLPSLERKEFEHSVAKGTDAMLFAGLALTPEDYDYAKYRQAFLTEYRNNISRFTIPFPGILNLLSYIELKGFRWGIVTNKIQALTIPLLTQVKLISRASCVVSGDSVANHKPHPEPLLYACKALNCAPLHCMYIGDTNNDILAGKAANMKTAAALYGFIPGYENPDQWGADILLTHPEDLKEFIG